MPNLAKAGCDAHPRHLGMSRRGRAIIAARTLFAAAPAALLAPMSARLGRLISLSPVKMRT